MFGGDLALRLRRVPVCPGHPSDDRLSAPIPDVPKSPYLAPAKRLWTLFALLFFVYSRPLVETALLTGDKPRPGLFPAS